MKIYGDYNSAKARIINIQLVLCSNEGYFAENGITCKSETERTQFLRNKFFLMLYNQKRFDTSSYTDKGIIEESKLLWQPINTQMRVTYPYKISKTKVALQDNAINLD